MPESFFLIKLHATYVYRTTMLAASVTTCYKCLQSLRYKIESNVTISISHGKSNHTLELKLYLLIPEFILIDLLEFREVEAVTGGIL